MFLPVPLLSILTLTVFARTVIASAPPAPMQLLVILAPQPLCILTSIRTGATRHALTAHMLPVATAYPVTTLAKIVLILVLLALLALSLDFILGCQGILANKSVVMVQLELITFAKSANHLVLNASSTLRHVRIVNKANTCMGLTV